MYVCVSVLVCVCMCVCVLQCTGIYDASAHTVRQVCGEILLLYHKQPVNELSQMTVQV